MCTLTVPEMLICSRQWCAFEINPQEGQCFCVGIPSLFAELLGFTKLLFRSSIFAGMSCMSSSYASNSAPIVFNVRMR